jgi:hypothetical protein
VCSVRSSQLTVVGLRQSSVFQEPWRKASNGGTRTLQWLVARASLFKSTVDVDACSLCAISEKNSKLVGYGLVPVGQGSVAAGALGGKHASLAQTRSSMDYDLHSST